MVFTIDPVLIAAAIIPAIILLIKVERADRLEKESRGLLVSLVLYGIFSTTVAEIGERLGMAVLDRVFPEEGLLYNALLYFGVVAFSEEGAKYVLLKRRTWNNPEFNCQFDGVVYGVFVSLGFALWENIGYVAMLGMQAALIRAVTAVPGHACFGVFMGAWYGMARRSEIAGNPERARQMRGRALLVPALLHGFYDFVASCGGGWMSLAFLVFIIAMFTAASRVVRRVSENDSYFERGHGFWR